MSLPLFAIFGASGCGRGVMPLARAQLAREGVSAEQLVFVDDQPEAVSYTHLTLPTTPYV